MNPQIADQVRALQKMSKLYPGRKKENAAKIQALMSNENVQNSQMAKSGKTESFTNGLVGALAKFSPVNILGSGMGYAGRVLNNKTLTETGEGLSEPIRQSQRDFQKQAGSQMSYQAGNIAGGIASSLGNPAGKAGMVLSMLRYGLPSAGDTSQAIQESGGSRTAQAIGGGLTGVAEGGLGAMLNYGTLASVPKSSPLFSTVARRALTAGVAGATENAGTQTIENLVAQRTYDKERPWYMNVPQAAATGAAMGAATRAAPEIYKNRKPLNEGGYLKVGESGEMNIDHNTPKKLTSGLQAQAYKDLDSFYNDYRPFFEDNFGEQAPLAAKKFYEASKKVSAMPTGAEGLRASSGAQTDFEQALATNDIVNARKAAVKIDDPVARREAMRSVGMQVDDAPSTANITNPLVKKMMEDALKRKANATQVTTPESSLESLKQEARTLYRGGEPLDPNKISSSGIPMTTSEKVADYYRGGKRNGVKESYTLSPEAKIKTVKNAKTESDRFNALVKAEKEGYDGVDFGGAESEIRLTNDSRIQATKNQPGVYNSLTDNLLNQTGKNIIPQKATQSQPPKSPIESLKQKARNYNSADSFAMDIEDKEIGDYLVVYKGRGGELDFGGARGMDYFKKQADSAKFMPKNTSSFSQNKFRAREYGSVTPYAVPKKDIMPKDVYQKLIGNVAGGDGRFMSGFWRRSDKFPELLNDVKKQGYKGFQDVNGEVVMFDETSLTDLYNQAKEKAALKRKQSNGR